MARFDDEKRLVTKEGKSSKRSMQILNQIAIALAIGILGIFLILCLVVAFKDSLGAVLTSLAGIALPPIVITFVTSYTPLFKSGEAYPPINVYFITSLAMLGAFLFTNFYSDPDVPLEELLFSFLITLFFLMFKYSGRKQFLAYSYGTLSGFLLYVFVMGLLY